MSVYTFEAYLPGPIRDFLHGKINGLRVWMIQNGMLADNPSAGESQLVIAAREAYESVERDLKAKKKTLDEEERDLAVDYGTDEIFRAVKGKCLKMDSGEYEYEMCWMDKTSQKPKKGGAKTTMGKFESFDVEEVDEEDRADGKGLGSGMRIVLRFDNGQGCWNGPQRRTDVYLACSETEELWRVSEAEKCVYRMEVGTPAACGTIEKPEEKVEEKAESETGKDEL